MQDNGEEAHTELVHAVLTKSGTMAFEMLLSL